MVSKLFSSFKEKIEKLIKRYLKAGLSSFEIRNLLNYERFELEKKP